MDGHTMSVNDYARELEQFKISLLKDGKEAISDEILRMKFWDGLNQDLREVAELQVNQLENLTWDKFVEKVQAFEKTYKDKKQDSNAAKKFDNKFKQGNRNQNRIFNRYNKDSTYTKTKTTSHFNQNKKTFPNKQENKNETKSD